MYLFSCTWWQLLLLNFPCSENMNKKSRRPDPELCSSQKADCLSRGCDPGFLNGKLLLKKFFLLLQLYSFWLLQTQDRFKSEITADPAIPILQRHVVPLWATSHHLLLSSRQGWFNHSHLHAPVSSSLVMYHWHYLFFFLGLWHGLQAEQSLRGKRWKNPSHWIKCSQETVLNFLF